MARSKAKEKLPFFIRFIQGVKKYGWIFIGLAIAALAISAIGSRESSHVATVAPIVMPLPDGSLLVTPEQLIEKLGASFLKPISEWSLNDIDIKRVEEVLEAQAFVADADAFVDDDLQLNIIVNQRIPLLRVIGESGQNYYLDEQGIRMPLSNNYTARVLVVTGNVMLWSDDFMNNENNQLHQLVEFTRYVRGDEILNALIEQVYVTNTGEWVLAPKVGDQVIYLGRYEKEKIKARLKRLKTFYREGLPYEGWSKYKSFDLRYNDQVVAQKK
ncbi:cell division protein FtsQ/DivIB [Neolewinella antarctica]|uniref:Cell division protein FtsQ n=1 Tax=Neolewinella antarctica TaxID=442734 RepID=A0ABX0X8C2_9BACT|nr:cell division protein FtsQ/DivIB [Neolewinella antarctica]NJC25280.1 cell division protein FtsQ [Neolewinella antarctica]